MTLEFDDEIKKRAARLHKSALVVDCHTDVHLHMIRERGRGLTHVLKDTFFERWKEGGVNVVVLNTMAKFGPEVYPYRTSPVHNFVLMADAVHQEILESPECFYSVLSPEDIEKNRGGERIGILLGLEGAEPVEMNLGFLRCYHRLGLRIMNLTWHQRNQVADGVAEPSNSGLSNFGREVVREMNRLGIMIDVSHLSKRGIDDVLALSTQPVIASHSNAQAVCSHERNLEDRHIRGIAEAGGMIGVVFLGRFVSEHNPSLSNVLEHVQHIESIAGPKHIGMGPDYTDNCQDIIISSRRVAGPNQPVDDVSIPYAKGLERMEDLPNFTAGLLSLGYSEETVRGVLGENFLGLFKKIFGSDFSSNRG
jgi:membrane dipeptidase